MSLPGRVALNRVAASCSCATRPLANARRPFASSAAAWLEDASTSAAASTSSIAGPFTSSYTLPKGLVLRGVVTKTGVMARTSTVTVERQVTHHKTLKSHIAHKKYLVHDPEARAVEGDIVDIRNCLPVSKRKRFELVGVIKGSKQRAVLADREEISEQRGTLQ